MTESTSPSAPAPAAGLLGVALFVLRQWRLILGLPLLLADETPRADATSASGRGRTWLSALRSSR